MQCNWHKGGDHDIVMFVEATPGGLLAKTYREALKEAGLKIRVAKRAGRSLRKILTKSDPFREDKCNQNKCKVCKLNWNTKCKGRGVVYKMKFQGCTERNVNDGLYIGEIARSKGERIGEHLDKYEIKYKNSAFHKHIGEKHGDERQELESKYNAKTSDGSDTH